MGGERRTGESSWAFMSLLSRLALTWTGDSCKVPGSSGEVGGEIMVGSSLLSFIVEAILPTLLTLFE